MNLCSETFALIIQTRFEDGLGDLIGIAKKHLENALTYTCMLPMHERHTQILPVGDRHGCIDIEQNQQTS